MLSPEYQPHGVLLRARLMSGARGDRIPVRCRPGRPARKPCPPSALPAAWPTCMALAVAFGRRAGPPSMSRRLVADGGNTATTGEGGSRPVRGALRAALDSPEDLRRWLTGTTTQFMFERTNGGLVEMMSFFTGQPCSPLIELSEARTANLHQV